MSAKTTTPNDGHLPELFSTARWQQLGKHLGLTPRQLAVSRLACKGLKTDTIAARLDLSPHTIRMHLRGLFERLDVQERVGMVVRLVDAERKM